MAKTNRLLRTLNKKSNPRFIQTLGLSCCCVRGVTPYFFLFCDVDSKDTEQLRQALKFYAKNEMSVYWYHTPKGFHCISPCMLNIEQWTLKKKVFQQYFRNFYEYLTIRWSHKPTKDNGLHFIDNSNLSDQYDESSTLHKAIAKRFNRYSVKRGIKTNLVFVKYQEYYL